MKTIIGKTQQEELHHALEIAISAAREAGAYLLSKQGNVQVVRSKALHDDLLDADEEAEAIIIAKLQGVFPTYKILSEEAGAIDGPSSYQWLIDPLDGSANFQHDSPLFGVTIGLLYEEEMQMSVIYLPRFDEMFTAIRGEGAFLNGETIKVSRTASINRAFIHFGDFAKNGKSKENADRIKQMKELANTIERVRMVGTVAVDLAYVACGRADGLVMTTGNPWDTNPGKLLVLEAGGEVQEMKKDRAKKEAIVIYSNGIIQKALMQMIQSAVTLRGKWSISKEI